MDKKVCTKCLIGRHGECIDSESRREQLESKWGEMAPHWGCECDCECGMYPAGDPVRQDQLDGGAHI